MVLQLLANGQLGQAGFGCLQLGHIGWRRIRRVIEQPFAHKHRPLDDMRVAAGRRPEQDRGLRQQTAALGLGLRRLALGRYRAECTTVHTIKTIVTRKRIVEHHKVRANEVLRAEVLPEYFSEKFDRLAADQFAQMVDPFTAAECGVHLGVHLHAIHGVDVQPLLHKRVDEPVCPLVGHHPRHLRRKGCLFEKRTTVSQPTKFIVRHGVPEKIRKARCQFM